MYIHKHTLFHELGQHDVVYNVIVDRDHTWDRVMCASCEALAVYCVPMVFCLSSWTTKAKTLFSNGPFVFLLGRLKQRHVLMGGRGSRSKTRLLIWAKDSLRLMRNVMVYSIHTCAASTFLTRYGCLTGSGSGSRWSVWPSPCSIERF